ncbi:hypothetical protein D3C85_1654460 [compost metagenome]
MGDFRRAAAVANLHEQHMKQWPVGIGIARIRHCGVLLLCPEGAISLNSLLAFTGLEKLAPFAEGKHWGDHPARVVQHLDANFTTHSR